MSAQKHNLNTKWFISIIFDIFDFSFVGFSNGNRALVAQFHSSMPRFGLMEFFDDEKNWGANEVRHGRAWRLEELRIKSNTDLHKLWHVLLKERNMLLTMEEECDKEYELFPSAERLDKVKESMANIETVVRERNRAYHTLETGEDGERPYEFVTNPIGLEEFRK